MITGKSPPKPLAAKQERPGLKMRDLVAATGVPKSTILHYLNEGLLPPPLKTSRNMAYYDPAAVERINFIKLMQKKYRLPLAVIKQLFHQVGQGPEIALLLPLSAAIFGRQDHQETLALKDFCRATGLTPSEVEELKAASLLLPLADDRYDPEDLAIGRALRAGLKLGLNPQDCSFYPRLAGEIVNQEMALRRRLTRELPYEQDVAVTMELTRLARALRAYVIDRVFQCRVMTMKGLKEDRECSS